MTSSPQIAAATPIAPQPTASSKEQMQAIQTKIASNPAIMTDIQALTANPSIAKLLANPALLNAAAQNPETLQGTPELEELLKDPQMQALIKKIQGLEAQP